MKNNSALFYTCSLIEYIGRMQRLPRAAVVQGLKRETIARIYNYADVFHCEPIEKTADDFIMRYALPTGDYDNVAACRYEVPDYTVSNDILGAFLETAGHTAQEVAVALGLIFKTQITDFVNDTFGSLNSASF